jgi:phosphatidylinositol-3-phosphatase
MLMAVQTLLCLALAATGCGSSRPETPTAKPTAFEAKAKGSHLAVIVMENKEYGDVIGNSSAPFINGLARRYGLATNSYGVSHPSLPNYLALTGGDTFGIDSDCTSCHVGAKSIVDELEGRRISWKAYMESMPTPCYRGGSAGDYAKKHDPFAYYDRIVASKGRCSKIVPYSQLSGDIHRGRLPKFLFISPNLCHDMHDCEVKTGDSFLAGLVPSLLHALGRHGVLFLTWDEGSSDRGCCGGASGGHIATVVAGRDVRKGARSGVPYDHYSVLRTISELLHIAPLRNAASASTKSLDPLFAHRPRL